tara:strand:- start:418 stop:594 length:177 start_codon:yes stop_codon:yes gene_type:complete
MGLLQLKRTFIFKMVLWIEIVVASVVLSCVLVEFSLERGVEVDANFLAAFVGKTWGEI